MSCKGLPKRQYPCIGEGSYFIQTFSTINMSINSLDVIESLSNHECFYTCPFIENPHFSNVQELDDVAIGRKVFKVRMRFKHGPAICYRGMLYNLFKYLLLLFIQEQKQIKYTKNSTKCQPIRRTSRGLLITVTPTRTIIITIIIWLIIRKPYPADPTVLGSALPGHVCFQLWLQQGPRTTWKKPTRLMYQLLSHDHFFTSS